jgi:hypothetical protein
MEKTIKIIDIFCLVCSGLRILIGRADSLDYWACWLVVSFVVLKYIVKRWGGV